MLALEIVIILIVLMFFVSFLYSNIGLGGGTLYVPIMVFIAFTMKRLEIIPVSLFLSFMTQLPAAYTHYKKGLVRFKLGFLLVIATIPGVMLGVLIGIRTTDFLAYTAFAVLLFIAAIKMIYDIYKKKFDDLSTKDKDYSNSKLIAVFFISIVTGIVSAFFGVGGGIVTVVILLVVSGSAITINIRRKKQKQVKLKGADKDTMYS